MKVLAFLGTAISAIGMLLGLWNQFSLKPHAESMQDTNELLALLGEGDGLMGRAAYYEAIDFVVTIGEITLLIGALGVIVCAIPMFKMQKKTVPLIGLIMGLVAVLFGLMHGTHMFS